MTRDNRSFSSEELWFLFEQQPPAAVVGLPDPTLGQLTSEKEALRGRIRKDLCARGVLAAGASGAAAIRQPLRAQLRALAGPRHTVLAVRAAGDGPSVTRSFNFTARRIVGLFSEREARYAVCAVRDPAEITRFLLEPLLTAVYFERDDGPFTVPQAELEKARKLIQRQQLARARELLQEHSITGKVFDRLVRAYRVPIASMALVTFLNRDKPERQTSAGLAAVATADDVWLFRPVHELPSMIEVLSVGKAGLKEAIAACLPAAEMHA